MLLDTQNPYYIDFPGRIRAIQEGMARENIDVYLGSRLRTMSWTTDAICARSIGDSPNAAISRTRLAVLTARSPMRSRSVTILRPREMKRRSLAAG